MKIITAVFVLSTACFASAAGTTQKGTFNIEARYSTNSMESHGLAIQDDLSDKIWILDRMKNKNHQFDMQTGARTGVKWSVADHVESSDQAFCTYTDSPDQFVIGEWESSSLAVFDVSPADGNPVYKCNIKGSSDLTTIYSIAAGNGYIYAGNTIDLTWGKYTGVETSIEWSFLTGWDRATAGMAVYGEYLFVCTSNTGDTVIDDNIFIFSLEANGSPSAEPVWSCMFTENPGWGNGPNGGIDFDGEFLWLCPMEYDILKISIDWTGQQNLARDTWASIKTSF